MSSSTATVFLALLATFCWPQRALAAAYDFQLLEFQIIGDNAFFDDFEDGLRDSGPTRLFIDQFVGGVTTESGGALRFTDEDGASLLGDGLTRLDNVILAPSFTDGAGGSVITSIWGPAEASASSQFGLGVDFGAGPSFFFLVFRGGAASPCGQGVLQAATTIGSGTGLDGCDAINPADITGNTVLRLVIDDERNEVRGEYSVDDGMTFVAFSGFDAVQTPVPIFESGFSSAAIEIYARGIPEPGTAALLICALLAAATRGSRRPGRR